MERERFSDPQRVRGDGDDAPSGDSLNVHRGDIDELYRVSDQLFDAIDHIDTHQYIHQNLQTGGE